MNRANPPPWPLVESQPLQDCVVFRVGRDRATSPRTGRVHTFFRIESPTWINVVPVTPEGEIVLVRQYRHGERASTLEIPGGMVDPGETPAEAAARELLEETGYGGGDIVPIGFVNPNPALFGNRCFTFLARDVEPVAPIRNEGAEETVVEVVRPEALDDLVQSGEIHHALVLAGLFWYDRWRRGHAAPGSTDGEKREPLT